MAGSYNKVLLMGNLTRDPEMRQLPSGNAVATIGLAVNRKFKTREGDMREEVTFVDCEAWGRTAEEAMKIYRSFKEYENAGAFACEIECVAEDTLNLLNNRTSIVTISLGSGNAGDIIFLFMSDICGESGDNPPKHAHAFRDLGRLHRQMYQERVEALQEFQAEVSAHKFPYEKQSVSLTAGELEKLQEALDKL